jgi:hypothetical protein
MYFVLGILISIPIAVVSPFVATALQRRLAMRSKKQGLFRIETLEREYAIVKDYHDNPMKLLTFIGIRILLLTVLWIGQGILDVIFGFAINGFYVAGVELSPTSFTVNVNTVGDWLGAANGLTDVITLTLIFRLGIRSYRMIKKVVDFDQYETRVKNELIAVREKDQLKPVEAPLYPTSTPEKMQTLVDSDAGLGAKPK